MGSAVELFAGRLDLLTCCLVFKLGLSMSIVWVLSCSKLTSIYLFLMMCGSDMNIIPKARHAVNILTNMVTNTSMNMSIR
jgi:hypothetical protein